MWTFTFFKTVSLKIRFLNNLYRYLFANSNKNPIKLIPIHTMVRIFDVKGSIARTTEHF